MACMHVNMYVYICIWSVHIYTHRYIYSCIPIRVHTCIPRNILEYINRWMCTYIRTHHTSFHSVVPSNAFDLFVGMHVCRCIYPYTCIYFHVICCLHVCMQVIIFVYMYASQYICICVHIWQLFPASHLIVCILSSNACMHACTYIHLCMCAYIHTWRLFAVGHAIKRMLSCVV